MIHELTPKRRGEVAAALDDDRLADVLEELPEDDQVEILGELATERAADVLEAMQPDDAADLLGELPKEQAEQLLRLMEPEEAADVRRLLSYGDRTAGGMMTTEPVVLGPDATIAEALAHDPRAELSPALAAAVYVCRPPTGDADRQVPRPGALPADAARGPARAARAACWTATLEPLPTGATLAQVTRHMASYNLLAVPVTDDAGRLLGAVTVDDVLDHLLPEDWRDADDDLGEGGLDEQTPREAPRA